ncbi:MAG: hypothetical protein ACFN1I_00935 [Selenomonas artemidis]
MGVVQTAGAAGLFFVLCIWIYQMLASRGVERYLAKILIVLSSALVFVSLNLYFAAKSELVVKATIEKYSVPSTVDLLRLMHEEGHTFQMHENRILIDDGTDHERIFILMREPFFHIMDQGSLVQMSKELPN